LNVDLDEIFERTKSSWEWAYFGFAVLASLIFLLTVRQDAGYVIAYMLSFMICIVILVFSKLGGIPLGVLTLGNPDEEKFGISVPLFSLAVGVLAMPFLMLVLAIALGNFTPKLPFAVSGTDFIPVAFGSALMESVLFQGFLLGTMYRLFRKFGVLGFGLVLSVFLIFFVQLNYVFLLLAIIAILWVMLSSRLVVVRETANNALQVAIVALFCAMAFNASFFSSLHAGTPSDHLTNILFSWSSDTVSVLTGGIAGSVVLHMLFNGMAENQGFFGLWWVPAVFWAIFVVATTKVISRRD